MSKTGLFKILERILMAKQIFVSYINEFTLHKLEIQIPYLRLKIYGINPVSN